jgi:hypothetical protein
MGTESRQVDIPVKPRPETYEFIIFRAVDIVDIRASDHKPETERSFRVPHQMGISGGGDGVHVKAHPKDHEYAKKDHPINSVETRRVNVQIDLQISVKMLSLN